METPALQQIDFLIIDAFSLLFRAFHAFPLSLTTKSGELTNAVFGFTRLLLDALEKARPEYVVVGTDMGKPTFRHQEYTAYKANRTEAPHELTAQIGRMYQVLTALNIPTIGVEGYEADDVIGTLATRMKHEEPNLRVGIFTGDKDAYQLVGENVFIVSPPRGGKGEISILGQEEVKERLGVEPEQVIDFKALCGDASDNIPGVRGIGPKSAAKLLSDFTTLKNIYSGLALSANQPELIDETVPESEHQALQEKANQLSAGTIKKLADGQAEAWLSQRLATIDTHVPLEFHLAQAKLSDYDKATALSLFDELNFASLKRYLPQDMFESSVQESLFGGI